MNVTVSIADLRYTIERLDLAQIEVRYKRKTHYVLLRSYDIYRLIDAVIKKVFLDANQMFDYKELYDILRELHPNSNLIKEGETIFDDIVNHEELCYIITEVKERVEELIPDDNYHVYHHQIIHDRIVIQDMGDYRITEYYRLEEQGHTLQPIVDVKHILGEIVSDIAVYTCNDLTLNLREAQTVFEAMCNVCHDRLMMVGVDHNRHVNDFLAFFDESIEEVVSKALHNSYEKLEQTFRLLTKKSSSHLILSWKDFTHVNTHVVEGTKGIVNFFNSRDCIYRNDYISDNDYRNYTAQLKLFTDEDPM